MKPTLLCILDGFGLNPNQKGNAVYHARKPNFDEIWASCPHTTLTTFGERVGLPEGQMGNSEVGHLNIGGGRVIEQWLLRISRALRGSYLDTSVEYQVFQKHLSNLDALHLIGLYSDGGVHSHREHLKLLIARLSVDYQGPVYLHLFTDGRDTAPQCAAEQIAELQQFIAGYPRVRIATITGRFYGMDRDKRWERTKRAFDAIVTGTGVSSADAVSAIKSSYLSGSSDEFIEPIILTAARLSPRDGIIFWNFREDRMRQIVAALCLSNFDSFPRPFAGVAREQVLCFTDYDHSYGLPFLFPNLEIRNHLGEFLSAKGLRQLRVAETEKYPHVTYFFNGGIETPYGSEERELVPSPRDVKTYDLKPEMSAGPVTDIVVSALQNKRADVIVVNLANCDMVGHTGVFEAAVRAVETVDHCLGRMLAALHAAGGQAVVIADHGNAEQMIDYVTGAPHTSHTMYPVPMILVGGAPGARLADGGALCDVAPTLLELMQLPKPSEMTGSSLLR